MQIPPLVSSLSLASGLLVATPAFATHILMADAWTNTTDRYLSGSLEFRLVELGTNPMSGEYSAIVRSRIEGGVKLHCARTLNAHNVAARAKCGTAMSIRIGR